MQYINNLPIYPIFYCYTDLEIVHFVSYNLHVRSNSFCENVVFSKHNYLQDPLQTQKSFWQTPTSNQKAFKLSAESDPLTDCKAKWILIRQFLSCRNKPSDINLKPPNNFCEVKKFLATRLLGYTTISRSDASMQVCK